MGAEDSRGPVACQPVEKGRSNSVENQFLPEGKLVFKETFSVALKQSVCAASRGEKAGNILMSLFDQKAGGLVSHSLVVQVQGPRKGAVEKEAWNTGLLKFRRVLKAFRPERFPQHRVHAASEKGRQGLFFTFQGRTGV